MNTFHRYFIINDITFSINIIHYITNKKQLKIVKKEPIQKTHLTFLQENAIFKNSLKQI